MGFFLFSYHSLITVIYNIIIVKFQELVISQNNGNQTQTNYMEKVVAQCMHRPNVQFLLIKTI